MASAAAEPSVLPFPAPVSVSWQLDVDVSSPPVWDRRSLLVQRGHVATFSASGVELHCLPMLIKHFAGQPSSAQLSRLRFEYIAFRQHTQQQRNASLASPLESGAHISALSSPSAGWPLHLLTDQQLGLSLLYADIGGSVLDQYQFRPVLTPHTASQGPSRPHSLTLRQLVSCAHCLVEHIQERHARGMIVNALCPAAILYNGEVTESSPNGRCLLLDYSQAWLLEGEVSEWADVSLRMSRPPGELDSFDSSYWAYMAPEATGRVNRQIDTRTDLYALGCILYELMTGEPPFTIQQPATDASASSDRLASYTQAFSIIHAHLAKQPVNPYTKLRQAERFQWRLSALEDEVAQIVAAIVLKLLAKPAEDRYQSAAGLLADLSHCERMLRDEHLAHPFSTITPKRTLSLAAAGQSNNPSITPHLVHRNYPPPLLQTAVAGTSPTASQLRINVADDTADGTTNSSSRIFTYRPSSHSSAASVTSPRGFSVGRTDRLSQFHVSQKLYGRDKQVEQLLSAFDRVAADGRARLVLVAGSSGIGKTSLVDEVHRHIVRDRGVFAKGKFDLYQRDRSVLLQAFQPLMVQLLTQSDLPLWRTRFKHALGQEAQVLIDVIPQLESVIGPQPPVPQLAPMENEKRLNSQFVAFLHVFCDVSPLVLFIDDLQWSDLMSLSLLKLMYRQESLRLLLVGTYRDNEIDASHALSKLVAQLEEEEEAAHAITPRTATPISTSPLTPALLAHPSALDRSTSAPHYARQPTTRLTRITLTPLTLPDTVSLVTDTLHSTAHDSADLARLLLQQSQGNPFYMNQILKLYHANRLLQFDYASSQWKWDVEVLRLAELTTDVVDLLVRQMETMSDECVQLLKVAACIGNTFTLRELILATQASSEQQVAAHLWTITQSGLVVPQGRPFDLFLLAHDSPQHEPADSALDSSDELSSSPQRPEVTLRFMHDRCQQAAYKLIPEAELPLLHLRMGRLLLQHIPADELDRRSIDVVGHVNKAHQLISAPEELATLVQLNLTAARRAYSNTAYQTAANCLEVAIDSLRRLPALQGIGAVGDDAACWRAFPSLCATIHHLYCECHFLLSNFEVAVRCIADSLAHVDASEAPLDAVRFYELQQTIAIAQNQFEEALAIGLQALDRLHFSLPTQDEVALKTQDEAKLVADLQALADLAEMTDPVDLAVMRILILCFSSAYFLNKPIFTRITIGMILWGSRKGRSVQLSYAVSCFVHVLHELQLVGACFPVGTLAKRMCAEYGSEARGYRGKVHSSYNVAVFHWVLPMAEAVDPIREANQLDLSDGDLEYYSYTACFVLDTQLYSGRMPLETLIARQRDTLADFRRRRLDVAIKYVNTWRICYAKLSGSMGVMDEQLDMDGHLTTQAQQIDELEALNIGVFLFASHTAQLTFSFYSQQFTRAIASGRAAMELPAWKRGGLVVVPQWNMYYSLSLLSHALHIIHGTPSTNNGRPAAHAATPLTSFRQHIAVQSEPQPALTHSPEVSPLLATVDTLQDSLGLWAHHAPFNYLHKHQLIEAVRLHVHIAAQWTSADDLANPVQRLVMPTLRLFDRAIGGACSQQFMHEEALGNELAALFCRGVGLLKEAAGYVLHALVLYTRWGCQLKVRQLKREYPHLSHTVSLPQDVLVQRASSGSESSESPTGSSSSSSVAPSPPHSLRSLTDAPPGQPLDAIAEVEPNLSLAAADVAAVMRASWSFSVETDIARLVRNLLLIVLQHAGASQASLLLLDRDKWQLQLSVTSDSTEDVPTPRSRTAADSVYQSTAPLEDVVPVSMLNYVVSTRQHYLLHQEAISSGPFSLDPYWQSHQPRAALMLPIVHQRQHVGLLYLENHHSNAAFTRTRVELLTMLSVQAALSIQNARLFQDVVRQKEEIEASKARVEHSMSVKNAFLANMSHELRTPLNALLGLSELALADALQPQPASLSEQRSQLQLIHSSAKVLGAILTDILDFQEMDSGKLQVDESLFDVREAVESAVALSWDMVTSKQLAFVYSIDPRCPRTVRGDSARLQQLLLNLLSNAAKFTQHGSVQLTVQLADAHEDAQQGGPADGVATSESAGSTAILQFTVTDTGIGIASEHLPTLFEPFTSARVRAAHEMGVGLGLAICQRLVAVFSGRISAHSQPGRGTSVSFTVTMHVPHHSDPVPAPLPSLAGRSVLVLSEVEAVRRQWGKLSAQRGAAVCETSEPSGAAVREAVQGQQLVNCVVLDEVQAVNHWHSAHQQLDLVTTLVDACGPEDSRTRQRVLVIVLAQHLQPTSTTTAPSAVNSLPAPAPAPALFSTSSVSASSLSSFSSSSSPSASSALVPANVGDPMVNRVADLKLAHRTRHSEQWSGARDGQRTVVEGLGRRLRLVLRACDVEVMKKPVTQMDVMSRMAAYDEEQQQQQQQHDRTHSSRSLHTDGTGPVIHSLQAHSSVSSASAEVPLVPPAPTPKATEPPTRHPPAASQPAPLRVMVAEDNPVNQKLILRLIARLGYPTPDLAADGTEVLHLIHQQRATAPSSPYDVLLLDLGMEPMDGFECMRRLRAEEAADGGGGGGGGGRGLFICVQTANAHASAQQQCRELGADEFIKKPLSSTALAKALLQAAARRSAGEQRV